mmetsp:Transcript_6413/g.21273  ORF Transcript_6413/g.21273 Transcript_6413/m.21273 type:complete len:346 (-) Transcript_6413:290-1327(-)
MITTINRHQRDPRGDIEFGLFGRHSRALLLAIQPMILAWAWKDALVTSLWKQLPKVEPARLLACRFVFAVAATTAVAAVMRFRGITVQQAKAQRRSAVEQDYALVLINMLAGAFGLFLAWCWNETAATLSAVLLENWVMSPSWVKGAEVATLCAYATALTALAAWAITRLGSHAQDLRDAVSSRRESLLDQSLPLWADFIDLLSISLGYMVGWAWSDAAKVLFLEAFIFSDAAAFYGAYVVAITAAEVLYTSHLARLLDNPQSPAGLKQFSTTLHTALGFMVGWAWKEYMHFLIERIPSGSGRIFGQYFQALTLSIAACVIYHKLRMHEGRVASQEANAEQSSSG